MNYFGSKGALWVGTVATVFVTGCVSSGPNLACQADGEFSGMAKSEDDHLDPLFAEHVVEVHWARKDDYACTDVDDIETSELKLVLSRDGTKPKSNDACPDHIWVSAELRAKSDDGRVDGRNQVWVHEYDDGTVELSNSKNFWHTPKLDEQHELVGYWDPDTETFSGHIIGSKRFGWLGTPCGD